MKSEMPRYLIPHSEARRLVNGLRTMIGFIETKIPADVIARKQTNGLKNAKAALKLSPDSSENRTEMATAMLWAFSFIMENYEGDAIEIGDAMLWMNKLGLINSASEDRLQ